MNYSKSDGSMLYPPDIVQPKQNSRENLRGDLWPPWHATHLPDLPPPENSLTPLPRPLCWATPSSCPPLPHPPQVKPTDINYKNLYSSMTHIPLWGRYIISLSDSSAPSQVEYTSTQTSDSSLLAEPPILTQTSVKSLSIPSLRVQLTRNTDLWARLSSYEALGRERGRGGLLASLGMDWFQVWSSSLLIVVLAVKLK